MHSRNLIFVLSILSLALHTGTLSAALIVEEYFNYASANGTNLGTIAPWTNSTNNVRFQTTAGPSFAGTGYVPSHAGGRMESGNANSNEVRVSSRPLGSAVSGEFWVSVFVNPTGMNNVNGSTTLMSFSSGSTSSGAYNGPGFGLYFNGSSLNYALFNGSAGAGGVHSTGTAATAASWQLLIARITINQDNPDAISVWAFANNAAVPTTVAGLGTATLSSSTLDWGNSVGNLTIGGQSFTSSGGKTALWDDIRVSNASGDLGLGEVLAIPEPGTLAMVGLTGLALLFGLRRGKRRA